MRSVLKRGIGAGARGRRAGLGGALLIALAVGPIPAAAEAPDGEGWLAAQVPIEIRPWGDEEAVSVFIAFPQTGRTRRGGEPLNIEGVAYNAPGGNVNVSVQSEDGRVLGEALVSTDDYGRWATEMLLPADISGEAVVRASIGDAASPRATTETVISVVPGSP